MTQNVIITFRGQLIDLALFFILNKKEHKVSLANINNDRIKLIRFVSQSKAKSNARVIWSAAYPSLPCLVVITMAR